MKSLFLVIAVAALVFTSCGSKEKKHDDGTHTHADGTVHEAHEHSTPDQEAFEVKANKEGCSEACKQECSEKADSTKCCDVEAEEKQEEGHDHDHGHDHNH